MNVMSFVFFTSLEVFEIAGIIPGMVARAETI